MQNFTVHMPTKIIFGTDSMDQIGENIHSYGKKVLLTYGGGSIKKNGIYDKVKSQLKDCEVKEFSGIEPNPRVETLRQAIELGKEFKPDIILAVGGGSVIDGSKLISAALLVETDAWDLVLGNGVVQQTVPLACVLTVSATGTEMNRAAVITNWTTHEKMAFKNDLCKPKFSILDPQNTFSVSWEQTAYGIVDIYSHVLEQYLNTTLDAPLQDRFAEGILLTLHENATEIKSNLKNYEARANVMLCSTLALNSLIAAGVSEDWACHQIEHELSAFHDIPHGAGLAIVTPRWMRQVWSEKLAKFVQFGRRVHGLRGSDEEVAQEVIESLYDFFTSLDIRMNLTEWGIDSQNFTTMVERLAQRGIGEQPLIHQQIEAILQGCL
ncbi:MAG TPA: iron-containing alcohol dehydrogenase [Candidatus Wirthbacteria bacterium]|nr:iron-containing alcohol dehydrogenase [Candidatus Wirthbacteria bacterium]